LRVLFCSYYSFVPLVRRRSEGNFRQIFFLRLSFSHRVGILAALAVAASCGFWLWKRRRSTTLSEDYVSSERTSTGPWYPPPRYSRCSSFVQALPPPYNEVHSLVLSACSLISFALLPFCLRERKSFRSSCIVARSTALLLPFVRSIQVTAKPDLYPLVIGYDESLGKGTSGFVMRYFRSLSHASTLDSLSSSFMCNVVNEANTVVPPPYSCDDSVDELSAVDSCVDRRPTANAGSTVSLTNHRTTSDVSSLAAQSPCSPPRATSPTIEVRLFLYLARFPLWIPSFNDEPRFDRIVSSALLPLSLLDYRDDESRGGGGDSPRDSDTPRLESIDRSILPPPPPPRFPRFRSVSRVTDIE